MTLDGIVSQTQECAARLGLRCEEHERTARTITLRLHLSTDLFVQVYASLRREKMSLALILDGQRIFGFDRDITGRHIHPFDAPEEHVNAKSEMSIAEFLSSSIAYLNQQQLI